MVYSMRLTYLPSLIVTQKYIRLYKKSTAMQAFVQLAGLLTKAATENYRVHLLQTNGCDFANLHCNRPRSIGGVFAFYSLPSYNCPLLNGADMPITKDDVLKIAELARLELTAAETESFATQLASIFNHIDKLNELDTTDVEPMSHSTTASGDVDYTRRDDIVRPSLGQQTALENAPDKEAGYFKVPKVIGG